MVKKVTKRERFTALLAVVAATDLPDSEKVGYEEFILHEISLLDKKRGTNGAPTKTQRENAVVKEDIVALLTEVGQPLRAGDISNSIGQSIQKVSALLKQLTESGAVVRTTDKKVTTFSVE